MNPDSVLNSVICGEVDNGYRWVGQLSLSFSSVKPVEMQYHIVKASRVNKPAFPKNEHYSIGTRPEQPVLCGSKVGGTPSGLVPDYYTLEYLIDDSNESNKSGYNSYCIGCLKQASFFVGVLS